MSVTSTGWRVTPAFTKGTEDHVITLTLSEEGITQFSGTPATAWQTPWTAVSSLRLMRRGRRGLALFATVGDTRYVWRHHDLRDITALREEVIRRGGTVLTTGANAIALRTLLTVALVGALPIGLVFWHTQSVSDVVSHVKVINVSAADVGPRFAPTATSLLEILTGTPHRDYTPTPRPAHQPAYFRHTAAAFQTCLGVSPAQDRVFGAAGVAPSHQIASTIFSSPHFGGVDVASITQYYDRTSDVTKDTAEARRPHFGKCLALSSSILVTHFLREGDGGGTNATSFTPQVFTKGFVRGGTVETHFRAMRFTLTFVYMTSGHYETELVMLSHDATRTVDLRNQLTSLVMGRLAGHHAAAV